MREPAMLADHLDQQSDAILGVWRKTVERVGDVSEVERLSYGEFLDHIPQLLDRLAERLRGGHSDAIAEGRKHGQIRWQQGYDIAELVSEFGHLRSALVLSTTDFARQHRWDITMLEQTYAVINDVIDEATAESVKQFQEDSRAETAKALAEVKKRQNAIEEAWVTANLEKSKLRTILSSLPVAVWVVDADGRLIGVNDEAVRLRGLSNKDEFDRIDVHELGNEYQTLRLDGSPYPLEQMPILRALGGEVVDPDEMLWVKDGQSQIVSINAAPLTDNAGAIVGAVAVIQDITRRKQVEAQLRRERDFSRAITDTLGEGLCTIDTQGRLTFINPAAQAILGWPEAEILGRDIHATIHYEKPDGSPYPREECPILGVFQTGETIHGDEMFIRKDGTRIFVAYTASAIKSDGQIVAVAKAFRDITERKRLEAQLAASEAQFRSIAEKSPVMIWRVDVDGFLDYANQTWLDFRGRPSMPGAALGESWAEGIHPEDRHRCLAHFHEAFAKREPFELTFRLLRFDGQYRWISDRGTPYEGSKGRFLGYLGSSLDITERIELETALEQQRVFAEEASRHKTQLVSALSHDARTPLNAVVLAAQLLELHFNDDVDGEVENCLRTIRHSVKNVLDLLGDLLDLSKIDAGAVPAELSMFPIDLVLKECLASIEPQARVKHIEIRYEPGPLSDKSLETDRSKLKQILSNLLSNALRYTETGFIRLFGELTEDQLRIGVQDSGIGIAAQDQGRIFNEFAMIDHTERPEGGTGLGLAICRRLATLLNGQIMLESEPGLGSTFSLVLPASVVTRTLPPRKEAAIEASNAELGTILIAEDHLDSRQTLARVLKRMGYRVIEASNGRDVLTVAAQEDLMAVLMDVNMPLMDGIEATLTLRADPRFAHLPIFALTGDVTLVNQHRIGEAGVNGYLEKPVTWDALRQALGTLGARRES